MTLTVQTVCLGIAIALFVMAALEGITGWHIPWIAAGLAFFAASFWA